MKEEIVELLLKDTLGNVEQGVKDKLEAVETSFEAQLDGLRTRLNSKINDITAVVEQRPLVVNFGTVEAPKTELVHSQFTTVVNTLKSQKRNPKNIMLVGEAGSGKTHLASSVAKALGLKFYPMSVGLQTTKSDLLGFINAHGNYVTSPVREAFENGGVLLLDEFDAAHAGVVTIINSLLANGHCSFPDKIVDKHDKFVCMVACNTYGHGANIDYVGRNRLDAATLDRFIVVDVGYDEQLEDVLTNNSQWTDIVRKIRKNIEEQGVKMIVSPRASMNGADLLDAGFTVEQAVEMCILKGADYDVRKKVLKGINLGIVVSKSISDYKRNLENSQVFVIRTDEENTDRIISVEPLNNKIDDENNERYYDSEHFCVHYGRLWSHQYTSPTSLYFSTKSFHEFSSSERDYVKEFFDYAEQNELKIRNTYPVYFEFIKKGCRNPYNVIAIAAEPTEE